MGFRQIIFGVIGRVAVDLPASNRSLADLAAALEESGSALAQRIANAGDSEDNRIQIRHIIGIERWGQRRLRIALGAVPIVDEYDDYRPAEHTPWAQLQEEFQATRKETVAIARALEQLQIGKSVTAYHNDFGDLSVRGWLRYLNVHANLEGRRIRG